MENFSHGGYDKQTGVTEYMSQVANGSKKIRTETFPLNEKMGRFFVALEKIYSWCDVARNQTVCWEMNARWKNRKKNMEESGWENEKGRDLEGNRKIWGWGNLGWSIVHVWIWLYFFVCLFEIMRGRVIIRGEAMPGRPKRWVKSTDLPLQRMNVTSMKIGSRRWGGREAVAWIRFYVGYNNGREGGRGRENENYVFRKWKFSGEEFIAP